MEKGLVLFLRKRHEKEGGVPPAAAAALGAAKATEWKTRKPCSVRTSPKGSVRFGGEPQQAENPPSLALTICVTGPRWKRATGDERGIRDRGGLKHFLGSSFFKEKIVYFPCSIFLV